jgi:hypothetical protein
MNRSAATAVRRALTALALVACALAGAQAADRAAPRPGVQSTQPSDSSSLAALPFVDDPSDEDLLLLDSLAAEELAADSGSGATLAATLPLLLLLACLGTFWRLEHRPH